MTSLGLFDAMADLARAKVGRATPDAMRQAREAVAEFVVAVGAKEIPISADLGRRAMEIGIEGGGGASRCFALACASAYRTILLTADVRKLHGSHEVDAVRSGLPRVAPPLRRAG